jgi:outer membrane protein assembly factor BamD (BamD/ComL family)
MYFATALEHLAAGNYKHASQELLDIENRFPEAPVTRKARDIRKRIDAAG